MNKDNKTAIITALIIIAASVVYVNYDSVSPVLSDILKYAVAPIVVVLALFLLNKFNISNFKQGDDTDVTPRYIIWYQKIRDSFFTALKRTGNRIGFFFKSIYQKIRNTIVQYIESFKTNPRTRRNTYVVLAVILIIISSIHIWNITRPVYLSPADTEDEYMLVRENVPFDGPIIVRLPEGIEKSGARRKVSFEPAIKTDWARTLSSEHIAFKLEDELEVGNNYKIVFDRKDDSSVVEKEFRAVERPRVDLFLPEPESVLQDEYTAITFMFNRPMVPLQSLDRVYEKELPIKITPETKGVFKWVSERHLEFIPETHLVRSSHYSVEVGESFMSVDGLQVTPDTYTFTVLPFLNLYASKGVQNHDYPLKFTFNQPVDIERLQAEVFVKDKKNDKGVDVDIRYASRLTYNQELKQKERVTDRSVIEVYPKYDEFGRAEFWDFDTKYKYEISEIYPLEGDIFIDTPITGEISVNKFVRSVMVMSPYSSFVAPDLFDPRGTLRFHLSEEIDIEKSIVSGKGVNGMIYEQRCVEEERHINKDLCKKEDVYDTIIVSFDDAVFGKGETFDVTFERAITRDGIDLHVEPQTATLVTVPELEITKITPKNGEKSASVSTLTLCSNVPLKKRGDEDYADVFKSDKIIDFRAWQRSQKMSHQSGVCKKGEYMTNIYYSLMADTSYSIDLQLDDQFGSSVQRSTSFTTQTFKTETVSKKIMLLGTLNRTYSVTTPQKTKFTLFAENFKEVNVSICKLSPQDMISVGFYSSSLDELPFTCLEKKTDKILVATEKNKRYYFSVDLKDYFTDTRGHYAISFSHPDYEYKKYINRKEVKAKRHQHIFTSVTNISLVEKKTNRSNLASSNSPQTDLLDKDNAPVNLYWATDINTLEPVSNADIFVYQNTTLYNNPSIGFATSTKTNSSGIARSPIIADVYGAYLVVGDETAVVSSWADSLNYARSTYSLEKMYLYTDRPIYRPGHEVFLKGIHRIGYDGEFETLEGREISLQVRNSRGDILKDVKGVLNEYGTFDTSFVLPDDAPLGTYRVNGGNGYTSFSVEEYVRSPFKVEIQSNADEYISGDEAQIQIDAEHFFGVPIQEGEVSYDIMAQDYFFDRSKDKRFNFGSGWYSCRYCGYGSNFVTRGKLDLEGGMAILNQETNFELLFEKDEDVLRKSKIFVVRATVKDKQGRSVSAQHSFIVHRADYYMSARFPNRFMEENTAVPFEVKTVSTKGYGISKRNISLQVERIEWQKYRRQEVDGEFYYKWKEVRVPTHNMTIATNALGDYSGSLAFPSAGQYEITLSGTDARGNPIWAQSTQYVYGDDMVPVKPRNDRTLDIAVTNQDYDVGDRPQIIIQSPYQKAKALVTVERGTVMDYEVIDVDRSFFDYDFTVRDEHVPNVFVSVVLLSSEPEIKYGEVQLNINRKNKELNINVLSNKTAYIPGEKVVLDVYTTNRAGAPVPAELSIAVVDMSVLALKGNPLRNPLEFFYTGMPRGVITSSNLKYVHEEIEVPTGTKGGDGSVTDQEKKKRGVFKDTAFWTAHVVTGANGYGTVSFTLPDNLTKWRVETIGITKDTKVGVDYLEFEEKKKIMTLPLLPRFVIPGDNLEVGAMVLNQTGQGRNVSVSFESDSLDMLGKKTTTHYIPSGGSKTIYRNTYVPLAKETGVHDITISAKSAGVEDTVEKIIPITKNSTYETVQLASFADGDTATEKIYTPEQIHASAGGLKIRADSSVAAFLEDALNYMVQFPYGCSEQLASKISTLAIVRSAVNIENIGDEFKLDTIEFKGVEYSVDEAIQAGLLRIYETQAKTGGLAYYKNLEPNYALSLHILSVFEELRAVGVEIDQVNYDSVLEYVLKESKQIKIDKDKYKNNIYELDRLLSITYPLTNIDPTPKSVKRQIGAIRAGITKKNLKKISSTSLGYAALLSDKLRFWDRRNVWKEIENRLGLDVDGVFLKANRGNINTDYYETGVKNTALLLQAIMQQKNPHKEYKQILKWLLAQRYQDGSWLNTNTTQVMVKTLSKYIVWQDEQHADFALSILLDDVQIGEYDTQQDSRIYGFEKNISFEELGLGEEKEIFFERLDRNDRDDTFYYDVSMKYYLDRDVIPARNEGIYIDRQFYSINDVQRSEPLTEASVGDVLIARIEFNSPKTTHLFGLEDILPAGFEPINFSLATEDKKALDSAIDKSEYEEPVNIREFMKTTEFKKMDEADVYRDDKNKKKISTKVYSRAYNPQFKEFHDDRVFLFSETLAPGSYVYEYYVRALVPGVFQHLPASASELYNPGFFGRTNSRTFTIEE
ncbi:alpha-2-macroglobulin [Patescibacteria group bacterium]